MHGLHGLKIAHIVAKCTVPDLGVNNTHDHSTLWLYAQKLLKWFFFLQIGHSIEINFVLKIPITESMPDVQQMDHVGVHLLWCGIHMAVCPCH